MLKNSPILIFDKSEIIKDGTHDVLIAKADIMQKSGKSKQGGFLPEKEE